jgi:putative drug exporter of the RND superfamily
MVRRHPSSEERNSAAAPDARSSFVRLADWSMDHRRVVVGVWVLLLVLGVVVMNGVGNSFNNTLQLPNTDSQRAIDLLQSRFPAQAGDVDQIVFRARTGSLTDPAVRTVVLPMLSRVARLPHITQVVSPYGGAGQPSAISKDGRIGYATIRFDKQGDALPTSAIRRVVNTAEAVRSPQLQVELGGNAIEQLHRPSPGPATGIGILAAAVILLLSFGSFFAMGLPVATAVFGLGTGAGLIALATHVLKIPDFAQQIALMISLGVGVDYALLVVTRYRDSYRRNGGNVRAAVEVAMDTAGRSITFAGLTVAIALLGLYAVGVNLLYGVALAATVSVLLVLAGSLTLLPAALSLHGRRVGEGRRRRATSHAGPGRAGRWITRIQRRPALAAVAATAVLLALAAPALGLRLALADAGTDQSSLTTRKAYDLLAQGFGKGFNGPLVVAARLPRPGDTRGLDRLVGVLRHTPDVAAVTPPQLNGARDTAALTVIPASAPESKTTTNLVKSLRNTVIPTATAGTRTQVYVGGFTAIGIDFTNRLSSKLPVFIAIVVALSALLLLIVFRSLLIPLQAAIMNGLSIGAALGVVQAVFERGWLAGPLGIDKAPVEAFLPVLLFAIVFGLSMDYEVFLVSRIHEEWKRTGDTTAAIREGVSSTGRVITAAAAVMIAVFASFAATGNHIIQLFGVGLASAIFLDAVVIRMILLPAILQLLGRFAWKFPSHLDRHLPRVAVEPPDDELATLQPVPEAVP